jgi:hypothetical protein
LVGIQWRYGLDAITPDEAVRALRVLADRGDARAAMTAGLVLDQVGKPEAAKPWFRRAFAGHVNGAGAKVVSHEYGWSNLRPAAVREFVEADALAGVGEAARWLGFWFARNGAIPEAVRWLRKSGGMACYLLALEQGGWASLVSRGVPEAERELFLLSRRSAMTPWAGESFHYARQLALEGRGHRTDVRFARAAWLCGVAEPPPVGGTLACRASESSFGDPVG